MTGGTGLLLWVVTGAALVAGLVGIVVGVTGTEAPQRPSLVARFRSRRIGGVGGRALQRGRTRLAVGGVAGAVVWAVTGVFVAAVLVLLAVPGVPWLLAPTKGTHMRIARLEALGDWTHRLSNVLRLGRGLDEALALSRKGVPEPIAVEVADLVDRLTVGWRPADALREFGDALDDVTADKVVAALILSAADRGPGLAQALDDLAASVHEEVGKRRQIEADRAKPRTTVRWMTLITLGVVAFGFLIPGYTAPYGTLLGQLVLALLAAGFVAVLVWMRQLADHHPVPRFLIADPRSRVTATPVMTPRNVSVSGATSQVQVAAGTGEAQ
ncbi:type II secretion system F family protein [Streptomyces sp. MI02-7b]|uniref:type II secretion system F family protein n=1 Tax=Streptomyces sp. MI02-7b TaxID=462941 RepID=UPI0029B0E1A1|nr:type II secretion system F family protein [Streptomyces sp. MI02-7b]MDX3075886.1 type II secretion system F family protein [Streptomyces sp. MI02-7b]